MFGSAPISAKSRAVDSACYVPHQAKNSIANTKTSNPTVCVIGAGPYGVSVASHLEYLGINYRIFGSPMRRWLSQMPQRMVLKSESCASSLSDPKGIYTLARYCKDEGLTYPDYGTPVSRELFARYATFFQRALVPNVEDVTVVMVSKLREGFQLRLSSGETLNTEKIIVATGLDHMAYTPDQIARLPAELRSHSADHYDFGAFKGKEVTVIGGGQSALETAAILREDGVSVRLLVRQPSLSWNPVPSLTHRSTYERLRQPRTRFGDGLGLWVYDNIPGVFHHLPRQMRIAKVSTALGPAGAWWLRDRVIERLPIMLGNRICGAEVRREKVVLTVIDQHERTQELNTDHVIAATGYKFNIDNLLFLNESLKLQLRHDQQSPRLSSNFESSISGMYFTSLGSANSFGPAMRFLAGADYTARRIAHHLARSLGLLSPPLAQREKCPEF
jgi:hypothetical protein